jgi:REP element-mobilizing transposase RayT
MPDHVHMLLSIPPKYAVSQVVGFIKGKSAIHMSLLQNSISATHFAFIRRCERPRLRSARAETA